MRRLLFLGVLALVPRVASAQVANPSAVDFVSTDQNTIIPAGQLNAGQPALASYQGMIFPATADVASGTPVVVGPVVAKTLAVAQPTANTYRLTYAQMGLTVPACTSLPCPQYTVLLLSIGPGGTSARAVAGESDPFTAKVPTNPSPPAGPTNVKNVP
jgi:hypothetical protein